MLLFTTTMKLQIKQSSRTVSVLITVGGLKTITVVLRIGPILHIFFLTVTDLKQMTVQTSGMS